MTSVIYYEETQALVQTLIREDQFPYFQDLWIVTRRFLYIGL